MQITLKRAAQAVKRSFRAGVVPVLHSSPGIGKSSIIHQIAEQAGFDVIDVRLAQCDPTDLSGYPAFLDKNGVQKAQYIPMDIFPLATDKVPEGKHGWILFFDEITSAPPAVQSAAYKIILDRMVGHHKLHPKCFIAGAGNLLTDNAVVEEMSTALQSRMVHFEIKSDLEEFLTWGLKNNLDERIAGFLNYQPHLLHKFDPHHNDNTFPCPRTWMFVNSLLNIAGDVDESELRPEIVGSIGEGAATDFITYCKVYAKLPRFEDILANPSGFKMDSSPAIKYATTMMVAYRIDKDNATACLEALNYIGAEFAFVGMRTICSILGNDVMKIPGMSAFFAKYGTEYLL